MPKKEVQIVVKDLQKENKNNYKEKKKKMLQEIKKLQLKDKLQELKCYQKILLDKQIKLKNQNNLLDN